MLFDTGQSETQKSAEIPNKPMNILLRICSVVSRRVSCYVDGERYIEHQPFWFSYNVNKMRLR